MAKAPVEQRFFSLLIGLGYPPPNRLFKWCVTRLKLTPNFQLISGLSKKHGNVITLLGTRESESTARKQSILKNSEDYRYTSRTSKKLRQGRYNVVKQMVYQPIRYFDTSTVWNALEDGGLPWGLGYPRLKTLYKDSSGECPLVADDEVNATSCGTRYGCFTCSVVQEDKSMRNFIQNTGQTWLQPLYDFRNFMIALAEDDAMRYPFMYERSTGKILKETKGGFNKKGRRLLLKELMKTHELVEKNKPAGTQYQVITKEEIEQIKLYWQELDQIEFYHPSKNKGQQLSLVI